MLNIFIFQFQIEISNEFIFVVRLMMQFFFFLKAYSFYICRLLLKLVSLLLLSIFFKVLSLTLEKKLLGQSRMLHLVELMTRSSMSFLSLVVL